MARRPVYFDGPQEGDGTCGKKHVPKNMGQDNEEPGHETDSRYERPPFPRFRYKKSGAYGKKEAMGRPPVKGASIPAQDKPEKDIDVRQTGQDHDEEDGS
jgi:hypothetical protein